MHTEVKLIDVNATRAHVQNLLSLHPEMAADETLRMDMIEGETDAFKLLALILDNIRDSQTMKAAIDERAKELDRRSLRYEAREDFMRKLALRIMETADLRKVQLPEATLSVRAAPPAVRIINPELIPEKFWRIKREPNLSQIKAVLKTGTLVSGCSLNNAPDVLAVLTR